VLISSQQLMPGSRACQLNHDGRELGLEAVISLILLAYHMPAAEPAFLVLPAAALSSHKSWLPVIDGHDQRNGHSGEPRYRDDPG
jgi:hypothetical protein